MTKITPEHLARGAFVYVRQSTADQLLPNAPVSPRARPISFGAPWRRSSIPAGSRNSAPS